MLKADTHASTERIIDVGVSTNSASCKVLEDSPVVINKTVGDGKDLDT